MSRLAMDTPRFPSSARSVDECIANGHRFADARIRRTRETAEKTAVPATIPQGQGADGTEFSRQPACSRATRRTRQTAILRGSAVRWHRTT